MVTEAMLGNIMSSNVPPLLPSSRDGPMPTVYVDVGDLSMVHLPEKVRLRRWQ